MSEMVERIVREVVIAEIDTEALTVTLVDGRVWPITAMFIGSEDCDDPNLAATFVAGAGEQWISERFSDFVEKIK